MEISFSSPVKKDVDKHVEYLLTKWNQKQGGEGRLLYLPEGEFDPQNLSVDSISSSLEKSDRFHLSFGFENTKTFKKDEFDGENRDWNGEFQALLKEWYTQEKEKEKWSGIRQKINRLTFEFGDQATKIARRIIYELGLSEDQKTIQSVIPKGYFHNGIIFRIIDDSFKLYESHNFAQKSAGHDRRNLTHLLDLVFQRKITDVHFPISLTIDYLGRRILAFTVPPISEKSLIYGSCNGGKTILAEDKNALAVMEKIAKSFNLKPHFVVNSSNTQKSLLYTSGDIEGHIGEDGLYYVCDLQRLMPPLEPTTEYNMPTYLTYLFRPEFIRKYKKPLSSDGFCRWAMSGDISDKKNKEELIEATKYLKEDLIPSIAKKLEQRYKEVTKEDLPDILLYVHRQGLNYRYLGALRKHMSNLALKKLLLMECVARLIKNVLKGGLAAEKDTEDEEYIKQTICRVFNSNFFGNTNEALDYWKTTVFAGLKVRFIDCLLDSETEGYDFRLGIDMGLFFDRLQQISGIHWKPEAKEKALQHKKLTSSDLSEITPIAKEFDSAYLHKAEEEYNLGKKKIILPVREKFYQVAHEYYFKALERNPININVLNAIGNLKQELAVIAFYRKEEAKSHLIFNQALNLFSEVIELKPKDRETIYNWGVTLLKMASFTEATQKNSVLDLAEQKFDSIGDKSRREEIKNLRKSSVKKVDINLKILIIGNGGVGKSSLMLRFMEDIFSTETQVNVGAEYKTSLVDLGPLGIVGINIFDTGGQEQFRQITVNFFRRANAIVVVYDITDRTSYDELFKWYEQATRFADSARFTIQYMIVGNKIDLEESKRVVDKNNLKKECEKKGLPYFETSAKDGTGVDEMFFDLLSAAAREAAQRNAGVSIPPPPPSESKPPSRPCQII